MKFEEILGVKLNKDGYLDIPQHIKRIRFDIGLSYCAPYSAAWLKNSSDVFVIGIEANKFCIEDLKKNGMYRPSRKNETLVSYPNENYMLVHCALDDVDGIIEKDFYHMSGDRGCSSLLKPTDSLPKKFGYGIEEISSVITVPFSSFLEKISFENIEYIELVKTDTQGKDLDIIKSAGEFLEKIVFIMAETNTSDYYCDSPKPEEYDVFMNKNNFDRISGNPHEIIRDGDSTYFNKKYSDIKNKIKK